MPAFLYDAGPNGLWVFLLVTLILGGAIAFMSGRAVAETWRPKLQAFVYALLIAGAVRFIHFALFEEVFLSLKNYIVDAIVLIALSVLGYNTARSRQMETQYGWLKSTPRS